MLNVLIEERKLSLRRGSLRVFEKMLLMRTCRPQIKAHDEEFHNLYPSANIMSVMMTREGRVTRMVHIYDYNILIRKPGKKRDLNIDGRLILRQILKQTIFEVWTEVNCQRSLSNGGFL